MCNRRQYRNFTTVQSPTVGINMHAFHFSLWMVEGGGLVQVPGLVLTKGANVVSLQSPKTYSGIR